jgi:hypothetical protein
MVTRTIAALLLCASVASAGVVTTRVLRRPVASSVTPYAMPTNAASYVVTFDSGTNAFGVFESILPGATNGLKAYSGTPRYIDPANGVFFNGTNAVLDAPYAAHLTAATSLTAVAWFKPFALTYIRNLFRVDSGLTWRYQDGIESATNDYKPYWYCQVGNPAQTYHPNGTNNTPRLELERWYHGAVTWDGATLRQYIDGALSWEQPATNASITIDRANGGWGMRSASSATYKHGLLDDLAMYYRAFSSNEVYELATGTPHATEAWSGTNAYMLEYRFDGGATDGYERVVNTGTNRGHGCHYNLTARYPFSYDGGARFQGTESFTTQYAPFIPSNETWGVSFYILRTNSQNATAVYGAASTEGVANTVRVRAYTASDAIQFTLSAAGNATILAPTTPAIPAGAWIPVGMCVDYGSDTVYVWTNGIQVDADSNTTAGNFDLRRDYITIGIAPGVGNLTGAVDDWRLHRNTTTNAVRAATMEARTP